MAEGFYSSNMWELRQEVESCFISLLDPFLTMSQFTNHLERVGAVCKRLSLAKKGGNWEVFGRANMFHNKLSWAGLSSLCQDKQNTCPTLWQHIITRVRVWYWLWVQNTINGFLVVRPMTVLLNSCWTWFCVMAHRPDLLLNAFYTSVIHWPTVSWVSCQIWFTMTLRVFWGQLLMRKLPFLCVVRIVCWGEARIASSLLQESEKFNTCRAFNFCNWNGLNFCFRFLL